MSEHKDKVSKSLRFSLLDGIFACGMMGFTQDYFTPFLLLLGAGARQVGILNAFSNLFSALVQLKSADITERLRSRRAVINIFVFLQAVMLVPITLLAVFKIIEPYTFIALVVLFTALGSFAGGAWASLMSDLIPQNKRGEYFGWRNRALGFIIVIATFIAGFILQQAKRFNIFYGFAFIFACAFIFRMLSWYFLYRMHEPALEFDKKHYFNLVDFLSRIKESNFAKFVIFVAMMNFAVNLASPFFAVLMLNDLHFNYMLYTCVTITATLTIYMMMSRWGRLADRVGNLRVMRFTAPLIGIIPFLWIINRSPIFLVFAQIVSGFAWSGFNLCASNFIYDAVTPEKRTRCVAYFNVFNGLALCLGALLGGALLYKLPALFGYKILSLFLISGTLRLLVGLYMPFKLREVRSVECVNSEGLFFSVIGIKPLLTGEQKP